MSEKVVVTKQGYEKMLESLKFLKTTKRREVADQLEKARAFGDLSENAEYETAKEAKNQLETRIRELEERVAHAKVVELDDIPKDKVYLGATVKVQNLTSKDFFQYILVSQDEANFDEGKIAVTSPIGKGLLGKALNEEAKIQVPAGTVQLKITEIKYE